MKIITKTLALGIVLSFTALNAISINASIGDKMSANINGGKINTNIGDMHANVNDGAVKANIGKTVSASVANKNITSVVTTNSTKNENKIVQKQAKLDAKLAKEAANLEKKRLKREAKMAKKQAKLDARLAKKAAKREEKRLKREAKMAKRAAKLEKKHLKRVEKVKTSKKGTVIKSKVSSQKNIKANIGNMGASIRNGKIDANIGGMGAHIGR